MAGVVTHMRMLKRTMFLALVFGVLSAVQVTRPWAMSEAAPAEDAGDGKFALLVGIDAYKGSIPPLEGGVNDARAMAALLKSEKFGFPEKNVLVLENDAATAKDIISSFRSHLTENARRYREQTGNEASVYFHYSGHGSHVAPPEFASKKEEPDGFDETIVPFDSRRDGDSNAAAPTGDADGYDIRDDEIGVLIAELTEQTSNAVLVFDSCNSGTISRGSNRSREVPLDKRKQPAYRISYKGKGSPPDTSNEGLVSPGDSFVVISSTSPDRRAYELEMPDGTSRGVFSFYLERAMREAAPDTTYGELIRRVAAEVNHTNSDQTPQLLGDERKLVFGGRFEEGQIPIPVVAVDKESSRFEFAAGSMFGLRTGSLVAVVSRTGAEIAEGEVTEVAANRSSAIYKLASEKQIDPKSDLVRILSPMFGSEPLRVDLGLERESGASDSPLARVRDEVRTILLRDSRGLIAFEESSIKGAPAGLSAVAVRVDGFRAAFCGPIDTSTVLSAVAKAEKCGLRIPRSEAVKPSDPVFYIAQVSNGEPLFEFFVPVSDPSAPAKISDALTKYARQRNLSALDNVGSEIGDSIAVEVLENKGKMNERNRFVPGEDVVLEMEADNSFRLPVGSFLRLRVINNYSRPLYITVLGLSTDGAINVWYPNNRMRNQIGGISPLMRRGGTGLTDFFRTTRPFGIERIKIIATTGYSDFTPLAQGNVTRDSKTAGNPLSRLLKQAIVGTRDSASGSSAIIGIDEWGVAEASMIVVSKD
ncbi:MAG: hypothetical protein DWQ47_10075 [Acidobacteria bacterium]|nr:MAG: hypothetical protein DWQ32_12490 [Acidobacteriota bacterium]REJ98663.1 MAG: hypothetical protein DWQ38_14990 [Acidobacteriota bacterium]REK16681.1 MAG: hypothetical protein DWQ43_00335 [Acidobacteriota bacterium]REK42592.1 MAG: hypothetical protein DWQ47_10075 [Acidobacteriota bacterium]